MHRFGDGYEWYFASSSGVIHKGFSKTRAGALKAANAKKARLVRAHRRFLYKAKKRKRAPMAVMGRVV